MNHAFQLQLIDSLELSVSDRNRMKRRRAKVVITRRELESTFIGFCAAIDWLARGEVVVSSSTYFRLVDETIAELIDRLANPKNGEVIIVEGIDSHNRQSGHIPIPRAIWGSVQAIEWETPEKEYRLLLGDDVSEWGGELVGKSGRRFSQLQMRSLSVLTLSESFKLKSHPRSLVREEPYALVDDRIPDWFEFVIRSTPDELQPLTLRELETLGKMKFPGTNRDKIREIAKNFVSTLKRGPKGKRNPLRKQAFNTFSEKIIAAQLHK